jgi:hypothetical protein
MASQQHPQGEATSEVLAEFRRRGDEADPAEVADADSRLGDLLEHIEPTSAIPSLTVGASQAMTAVDEETAATAQANLSQANPSQANPSQANPSQANPSQAFPEVRTRTARAMALDGRSVSLRVRGSAQTFEAELAPGVDPDVIAQAIRNGDHVVVESEADGRAFVVGVLQTRIPREITLKADKVHIEAREELLLRSGRAAMRLRQDGDVELVGSRISAMSRGLFRLVGRVLRLN